MQSALDADVRVIAMPAGRDPDDVIRWSPDAWPLLVDAAVPFLDFRFNAIVAKHNLGDPRERSAVVAALAPMIAALLAGSGLPRTTGTLRACGRTGRA